MKYSFHTRVVSSILDDIANGKSDKAISGAYRYDYYIQRPTDQWKKRQQKGPFIISLLKNYPVNPIYVVANEDNQFGIIDGIQRLSSIEEFRSNKYSLPNDAECITVDGEVYDIAKKKFRHLPDVLKKKILGKEISVCEITDYTKEEIKDLFFKLNNGSTLTASQKNISLLSDDLIERISLLEQHPVWDKVGITKAQINKGDKQDLILESMMLFSPEIYGFKRNVLYYRFVPEITEANSYVDLLKDVKLGMDKLNELLPSKLTKIKKPTIPMVVYAMSKCVSSKKSTSKFVEKLIEFNNTYDSNEEYKTLCKDGTADKEKVIDRKLYFMKIVNRL